MPFELIDLQSPTVSQDDAVQRAADALRTGQAVVLPTETVYGLAVRAADADAVLRLIQIKGRAPKHPFALALPNTIAVSDYATEMSPLAERLARRCLPGPVSLVLDVSPLESAYHLLPKVVRSATSQHSSVSFRVPAHPFTQRVLAELDEPVVLTSANRSGKGDLLTPDAIIAELGTDIDLLVADGEFHAASPQPSTVVRVLGNRYAVLREGAMKQATLERLTARMFLFVCTGNTCRSPMAERICERLLAARLGCSPDSLEDNGFVVFSAGLAAGKDVPASPYAVEVMNEQGTDLSDHRSQLLNETHTRFADYIFAMTRSHREAILSLWPHSDTRLNVLRVDGGDIADPFGSSGNVYRRCAQQLETEINKRLDQIL